MEGALKSCPQNKTRRASKKFQLMFLLTGSLLPHRIFVTSTVILLPLRPASLMHKNSQRRKIIHTQTSDERSEDVL